MQEFKQERYLIKHFRDLYVSHNSGLMGELNANHLDQFMFNTKQKATNYLNKFLKIHPFKDGTFKVVKATVTIIVED